MKSLAIFFNVTVQDDLERNNPRVGKEIVPASGIWATHKKLLPAKAEGFDTVFKERVVANEFSIWQTEE